MEMERKSGWFGDSRRHREVALENKHNILTITKEIEKKSDYILTLYSRKDTLTIKEKQRGSTEEDRKERKSIGRRIEKNEQELSELFKKYQILRGKKHWLQR